MPVNEMVQVVAPSNLEGGYLLDIMVNGETKTIVVPEGGVNAGEEFVGVVYSEQPLPPAPPVKISQTSQVLTNVDIPIGHFRDDMFDCCFDLPLACFAFWCQPIVLGQVMTRLHLNFCCCPGSPPNKSWTCYILTGLNLLVWILLITGFALLIGANNKTSTTSTSGSSGSYPYYGSYGRNPVYTTTTAADAGLLASVGVVFWLAYVLALFIWIYLFFARCRTRMIMREKYGIRASCCGDCCATSRTDLGCCVVSQMARHTNDYEAYPVECCSADCFSRTGQNVEARANDQVVMALELLGEARNRRGSSTVPVRVSAKDADFEV